MNNPIPAGPITCVDCGQPLELSCAGACGKPDASIEAATTAHPSVAHTGNIAPKKPRTYQPKVCACGTTSRSHLRKSGRPDTVARRLYCRVSIDLKTGCWNFSGALDQGYGVIYDGQRARRAHIVSYQLWNGPVSKGVDLHHVCENRRCCNPTHLVPLPHDLHTKLAPNSPAFISAQRTHCPRGHPFSGANLGKDTARRCLACRREDRRALRLKNRGSSTPETLAASEEISAHG